jgi:hypothetical protein
VGQKFGPWIAAVQWHRKTSGFFENLLTYRPVPPDRDHTETLILKRFGKGVVALSLCRLIVVRAIDKNAHAWNPRFGRLAAAGGSSTRLLAGQIDERRRHDRLLERDRPTLGTSPIGFRVEAASAGGPSPMVVARLVGIERIACVSFGLRKLSPGIVQIGDRLGHHMLVEAVLGEQHLGDAVELGGGLSGRPTALSGSPGASRSHTACGGRPFVLKTKRSPAELGASPGQKYGSVLRENI